MVAVFDVSLLPVNVYSINVRTHYYHTRLEHYLILCMTDRYSFYDGPPFATGLPHYGHILAGTIKDIVTRYAYQNGYYVERRFGWDCHGLPVVSIGRQTRNECT